MPRMMPTVIFRDKTLFQATRIHTILTEKGMDGKADRVLWDAMYDKSMNLAATLLSPGKWDFTFSIPVPGSKKPNLEVPCVNKWDPR